jgi:uncharacterized protein (DUF1778 family)
MYTKDKAQRITLRLNEEQFEFVRVQAEILEVSPSEFLRMVVNTALVATKMAKVAEQHKESEGNGRENDKADINNIV